jgi:peptidoglycan hydrolase-like protein with peptidoglycan-binding domain
VTNPSDNVVLGDTGPGVEEIQTALLAHGFRVVVDGDFGPQTDEAVRAFQKQSGIAQDGIVGPVTWSKLQASPSATTTSVAVTDGTTATT